LLLIGGCRDKDDYKKQLEEDKFKLQQQKRDLERQLEAANEENQKLNQQVEVLTAIGAQKRIEGLYRVKSIQISKYTNFYDKDKDGRKEKLIVYIKPVDSQGDVIKAGGSVAVELWDLEKDEGAKLARWQIEANELKTKWAGGLAGANYRLLFDIADVVSSFDKPLTVKIAFTDYLNGNVFREQYVIKP
jgi:hypothetical protein